MSNGKTPNGYAIKKSLLFENGKGFVLGENQREPEPFATWQFTETNGKRDYYWGHYKKTLEAAEKDFAERVTHYKQMYRVSEKAPTSEIQYISEQLKDCADRAMRENAQRPASLKKRDKEL